MIEEQAQRKLTASTLIATRKDAESVSSNATPLRLSLDLVKFVDATVGETEASTPARDSTSHGGQHPGALADELLDIELLVRAAAWRAWCG